MKTSGLIGCVQHDCEDCQKRLTQPVDMEPVAFVKENTYCPEGTSDEMSKYLPVGTSIYSGEQVARLQNELAALIAANYAEGRQDERAACVKLSAEFNTFPHALSEVGRCIAHAIQERDELEIK